MEEERVVVAVEEGRTTIGCLVGELWLRVVGAILRLEDCFEVHGEFMKECLLRFGLK